MIRLGIRVRADDAEIAYARLEPVLAAGAEEIEFDDIVEFALYGDGLPSDDEVRALAGDALVELVRSDVESGWAQAWQDHLTPVRAGGFTIRPPWLEGFPDDLVINPGPSFGAASHPTTRLCLELLRAAPRTALADWGTGSGVLAIAAARLGFAPVVAIELDSAAAHAARRNAVANGVEIDLRVGDVTHSAPWAPTVVANLTLPLLVAVAGEAAGRAAAVRGGAAGGDGAATAAGRATVAAVGDPAASHGAATAGAPTRLIASGVLAGAADEPVAAWARAGFSERERRELDGWAALVLER